jgi:adenylate cyclase
MEPKGFHRKLTAILSADVAGYSRLMQDDESATVRTLEAYKQIISDLVKQHRGRVVDSPGDNLLAEFASVVDGVQCAVAVQKELQALNSELPENRRMLFRIGVNLGDVIEEAERIYGDGVNIAARLERMARPGGLCISGNAFEQIENKLPLHCDYLGEHEVKNISRPVRVYRAIIEAGVHKPQRWKTTAIYKKILAFGVVGILIVTAGVVIWQHSMAPAPKPPLKTENEKLAYVPPSIPSLAVLPFANLSGDSAKDYLSDGLSDSLINAMTKLPQIFVVARNSSFTYKGKNVDVKLIGRELGVTYVLEGSVQWSGDNLRIAAQLIDATTGLHAFSEQYDRGFRELFALQDDITIKVMTAMRVKLTEGEEAQLFAKGTQKIDAYLKAMQANHYRLGSFSKDNMARARQLGEEAIALDPNYGMAYSIVAGAIGSEVLQDIYKDREGALDRGMTLAQKAVSLDESNAISHYILGYLHILRNRDYEKGIAEAERAVALEPNSADAYTGMGMCLFWGGRFNEAIPALEKAIRLSPIPSTRCMLFLAITYRAIGKLDESITIYKNLGEKYPNSSQVRDGLVASLVLAGREDEAQEVAAEIYRIDPGYSLERTRRVSLWKNMNDFDKYCTEPMRKGGLK